jgi:flagellum-specific ATP synthase
LDRLVQLKALARSIASPGNKVTVSGYIKAINPSGIKVCGLSPVVRMGDLVRIRAVKDCLAETVAVDADRIVVKPLDVGAAVQLNMRVDHLGEPRLWPSDGWLGRTISALGEPVDGKGALDMGPRSVSLQESQVLAARDRAEVTVGLRTGVRVIDAFTPLCFGQRIGVFAGSGVGKSTLLAMLARAEGFDVAVIALVGERGREVNEFINGVLGAARQKSVVVVATSDESASCRRLAPSTATAIAEYFRDKGKQVLLIMDSVTRFASAAREIAMAAGEPPVARGFPPSVFAELPRLLERAGPGTAGNGTITGIYSVLVDGDNHNEPIADAVRGILDGHIVLDREIANGGRLPAVDVLASISRLASRSWTAPEARLANEAKRMVSRFESTKELRLIGNYQKDTDKDLDVAVEMVPRIYSLLAQEPDAENTQDIFAQLQRVLKPAAA